MNIDKRKLEVIIDVFSDLEHIYESEYSAKLSEEQQTLFKELKEALTLTSVVGRSEQYFCCKDQINQRCGEQCLGCFQFENKD
ncbi:hypothetical protein OAT36_06815 [Flavobacteriaceae bacterium]|nr:hypothetical protein [Flavobacteriaceae bacterium]